MRFVSFALGWKSYSLSGVEAELKQDCMPLVCGCFMV